MILALLRSLVHQRWLIIELIKRELKLRYRGTWLGFAWTLLNPLVYTVVYTLVFSLFLRIGIPKFPAFLLTGLLPWIWFSESISSGTNCIVDHAGFLRNAVFPAQVLPVVAVGTGMMNYIFSIPVLITLLLAYGIPCGWEIFALPIVMASQFILALAIVYFTATYNVFLRDIRYIVQNMLLVAFFLTPVMYDLSVVPVKFQAVLKLNPMTIIVDSYRRIFFWGTWPHWRNLVLVSSLAVLLLVVGIWVFRVNQEVFAEHL